MSNLEFLEENSISEIPLSLTEVRNLNAQANPGDVFQENLSDISELLLNEDTMEEWESMQDFLQSSGNTIEGLISREDSEKSAGNEIGELGSTPDFVQSDYDTMEGLGSEVVPSIFGANLQYDAQVEKNDQNDQNEMFSEVPVHIVQVPVESGDCFPPSKKQKQKQKKQSRRKMQPYEHDLIKIGLDWWKWVLGGEFEPNKKMDKIISNYHSNNVCLSIQEDVVCCAISPNGKIGVIVMKNGSILWVYVNSGCVCNYFVLPHLQNSIKNAFVAVETHGKKIYTSLRFENNWILLECAEDQFEVKFKVEYLISQSLFTHVYVKNDKGNNAIGFLGHIENNEGNTIVLEYQCTNVSENACVFKTRYTYPESGRVSFCAYKSTLLFVFNDKFEILRENQEIETHKFTQEIGTITHAALFVSEDNRDEIVSIKNSDRIHIFIKSVEEDTFTFYVDIATNEDLTYMYFSGIQKSDAVLFWGNTNENSVFMLFIADKIYKKSETPYLNNVQGTRCVSSTFENIHVIFSSQKGLCTKDDPVTQRAVYGSYIIKKDDDIAWIGLTIDYKETMETKTETYTSQWSSHTSFPVQFLMGVSPLDILQPMCRINMRDKESPFEEFDPHQSFLVHLSNEMQVFINEKERSYFFLKPCQKQFFSDMRIGRFSKEQNIWIGDMRHRDQCILKLDLYEVLLPRPKYHRHWWWEEIQKDEIKKESDFYDGKYWKLQHGISNHILRDKKRREEKRIQKIASKVDICKISNELSNEIPNELSNNIPNEVPENSCNNREEMIVETTVKNINKNDKSIVVKSDSSVLKSMPRGVRVIIRDENSPKKTYWARLDSHSSTLHFSSFDFKEINNQNVSLKANVTLSQSEMIVWVVNMVSMFLENPDLVLKNLNFNHILNQPEFFARDINELSTFIHFQSKEWKRVDVSEEVHDKIFWHVCEKVLRIAQWLEEGEKGKNADEIHNAYYCIRPRPYYVTDATGAEMYKIFDFRESNVAEIMAKRKVKNFFIRTPLSATMHKKEVSRYNVRFKKKGFKVTLLDKNENTPLLSREPRVNENQILKTTAPQFGSENIFEETENGEEIEMISH